VSTTVIEVGVNVPNATVMVVLDADRFGVAQLHQLRGRVGRGSHPGLCLLLTTAEAFSPALERVQAVAATTDGFELSQIDLELRRGDQVLTIKVPLERAPASTSELQEYHSEILEFKARDLCKEDQLRERSKDDEKGVLITSVANAGWAALAGLQSQDLLRAIDGKPIDSIAALQAVIDEIEKNKPSHITFYVKRGILTRMIEMEPTW